ncbi:hypothetical protein H4S08_003873 [Coemansia sp. RSA 1365]|nr:hypothetical protein H4S08_003873 [Coemansia sp. RSA 1365]
MSAQQGFDDPLCKFSKPWPTPAAKWTAGKSITVEFGQHAVSHSGGHCEFSISYDGGKTFVVIHQELRYCFVGKKPSSVTNEVSVFSYTFKLPENLPSSDKAVFSWTWVNASGNREFYMNCADVSISGTSKSFTGKEMTIANYKDYPTIPEFNMDYETGIKYYTTDAKNITVTGDGSGGAAPANEDNDSEESPDKDPVDQDTDNVPLPTDGVSPDDAAINTDGASLVDGATDTPATATTIPTATGITAAIPTYNPAATATVTDGDSNNDTNDQGDMCCQNCCGCNGGYNGGWFPGMQNMGGYQQYGYYGPGYIIPNPGMDMGNNYFYAYGNGQNQGQYQGGGQAGYQGGYPGGGQYNYPNNNQVYGQPINNQGANVPYIY